MGPSALISLAIGIPQAAQKNFLSHCPYAILSFGPQANIFLQLTMYYSLISGDKLLSDELIFPHVPQSERSIAALRAVQ